MIKNNEETTIYRNNAYVVNTDDVSTDGYEDDQLKKLEIDANKEKMIHDKALINIQNEIGNTLEIIGNFGSDLSSIGNNIMNNINVFQNSPNRSNPSSHNSPNRGIMKNSGSNSSTPK